MNTKRTEDHILVIFGASGDLTKRKLMPALYALEVQRLLPERFAVLGVSRSGFSESSFRSAMREGIEKYSEEEDKSSVETFISRIHYQSISEDDPESYNNLKEKLIETRRILGTGGNTMYYLSTPPSQYGVIPKKLAAYGLQEQADGWKRLIIEKPFGYDLESARSLNQSLYEYWQEEQIYRIDHYLGKETVQNVLVTRFSNGIFEPLWNRNYIERVEITSAESIGVEKRGGYYEGSGALRDMIQNHLLQLVGLMAMEPPTSMDSNSIRNEVLKVFQSLRPLKIRDVAANVIRGQYLSSHIKGELINGYREEPGVNPDSKTETYAAVKFYIDNWRWGGIPFYIRTGKRLPTRVTEAVIHFRPTPHPLFSRQGESDPGNQLVLRIQPDEGILLKFGMKTPGAGFQAQTVNMDFHYSDLAHQRIPTAYERLILDAMQGDSTLYTRGDAVLEAWKFIHPILEAWRNDPSIPVFGYPSGTWGPVNADELIAGAGQTWRYPCKNLADDGIYCNL